MANGITFLPAFGQQEANTAVLPENNQVLNTYLALSEKRFSEGQQAYKEKQDEIKRKLDAIDFNLSEVAEQDFEPLLNRQKELMEFVDNNPEAVDPNNSEWYPLYVERAKKLDHLINLSKLNRAEHNAYNKLMVDNPEYATPENEKILKDYMASKVGERNMGGFRLPIEDNPIADAAILEKFLVEGNPELSMTNAGYGFTEQTTTTPIDTKVVENGLDAMYKSSWRKRRTAEETFSKLSEEQKKEKGIETPYDVFRETRLKLMKLDPKVKKAFERVNYAPQSSGNSNDGVRYIAENAFNILDTNSGAYSVTDKTTVNGKPYSVSHAFDNTPINIKLADGTPVTTAITGLVNIGGKIYAKTADTQTKTGSIAVKDLIPITDVKTQLITPYVNQQYGSSQNTAELVQKSLDLFEQMKGKKTGTQSGQKKYTLAEIKAAYPNELKDYTDEEIREAYKSVLAE